MTGVNFQTNTFEFNTQALDGQTLVQARTVDDAPLDDPQAVPDALQNQVYVSDAPAVGLINVDTSASSSELGATGNRAIRWLWISGNTDGLLEVAIVDAITRRVMEVISGPLVRRSYYRSTPFLVPQGALLRVTGLTGEVLVRFNVTDDDQCCVGVSGSGSSHDDSICCSEVFAVSPPEIGCPYQSIQEAIDAAFAYSQQFDAFGFVHVLTGTYEEDVSAARGVIVRGEFGSLLKGTLTIDLGPGVPRDQNITAWVGVDIEQENGPGVHFTGSNAQAMLMSRFSSETANGSPMLIDNDGGTPADPSFIDMDNVDLTALSGNPEPALDLRGGVVLGNEVSAFHEDVDTGLSAQLSSPAVGGFFRTGSFEGRILINEGVVVLRSSEVVAEGVAAVQIGDAGICIAQDTVIDCDVSPAVDGTGVFAYANIIFSASQGIAGTLAFVAPQAVQGSENLVYAATPASWAGAAPTRQQDATSRLAAFVAANIGPIT